jgi:hypothetical protein
MMNPVTRRAIRVGEVPGSNPGAPICRLLDAGGCWGRPGAAGLALGVGFGGVGDSGGGLGGMGGLGADRTRTAHAGRI